MLRLDLICLTNSGISSARITRVSPMIDSAQADAGRRPEDVAEDVVPAQQDGADQEVQRLHDEAADVAEELHSDSSSHLCETVGRNRVIATQRPGVAPQHPSYGEPGALDAAVHRDRLESVGRAGRVIPAHLPVQRADRRTDIRAGAQISRNFTGRSPRSPQDLRTRLSFARGTGPARAPARSYVASAAAGSARTTSMPSGGSEPVRSRARCRSRRLTRLRVTAGPTALETTKPTRGPAAGPGWVRSV